MNDQVCVLLSVYNGSEFLAAQLKSLADQTHANWVLLWRDDGSKDNSYEILENFAADVGVHRVKRLPQPSGNMGIAASFMHLLSEASSDAGFFAFCDQDDVWFPDKLARAIGVLQTIPENRAGLYCSRQALVDANLRPIGLSPKINRKPSLANALVQNIATGCTIVMNREARRVVIGAAVPEGTLHDHWTYLVVCAAAGEVFFDPEPSIFYRQHGANAVGSQAAIGRRIRRALGRGPGPFLRNMANNLGAIAALEGQLPEARKISSLLTELQSPNPIKRVATLARYGIHRQTMMEDFLMRVLVCLISLPQPLIRFQGNDDKRYAKNAET
jgi:glycosyltransferase involved in cell wall biosynthesis